jgi:hypothetical protein
MKFLYLPVATLAFWLMACDDPDTEPVQDQTHEVDKQGAVELALQTVHLDSTRDVMTSHYKIWAKGQLVREFTKHDTLPRLGRSLVEYQNEAGSYALGDMEEDYEFYVTVK